MIHAFDIDGKRGYQFWGTPPVDPPTEEPPTLAASPVVRPLTVTRGVPITTTAYPRFEPHAPRREHHILNRASGMPFGMPLPGAPPLHQLMAGSSNAGFSSEFFAELMRRLSRK
jgi:hypothetical protein